MDESYPTLVDGQAPSSRASVDEAQRRAEKAQRQHAPLVELTPERIAELRQIAAELPGGHQHLKRVERALMAGPLNSVEALHLGSLHVPARIQQLAKKYDINFRWVRCVAFDDEIHRIGEWTLASPATDKEAA